ncbi:unnamed protein product [Mesocestoides corti]|uniref:IST1 homolog n=1 Tax=Mesocestoides corti TaxID=53468 RepID=A0A0R3U290_MESCO|nr:unnamed protein product [Mesocestoides corti]
MFAPRFDSNKLKTNLRISGTRLKNLYKKKNELNVRARRELAEYLKAKKIDRARIRVEQIVEIARSYDVEFTPDENLLNNTSFGGKLVDLGEPPSLPPYDLMSSDFLDAEKTPSGPGAPYPVNTGASAPSAMDLPSIPGESGQQFHDFKGPEAPPPYQHPDDASGTKLDDEDEKKASGGSGPLPPPTTDDDDFDALSARFNNLRKDK